MDIVLLLHSFVRYIVLLAAGVGLIKTIYNLAMKNASERADSILASIFLGSFDLQTLLGVLIILLGGLRGPLHPLLMFVALVIAHGIGTAVKRGAGVNVNLMRFAFYLVPLAIILFGLLILGQLRI